MLIIVARPNGEKSRRRLELLLLRHRRETRFEVRVSMTRDCILEAPDQGDGMQTPGPPAPGDRNGKSAVPELAGVSHVRTNPACAIAAQVGRASRSFGRIGQLPRRLQRRPGWPNPCGTNAGPLVCAAIGCPADRRKAQLQAPEQVIHHGLARIPAGARARWQSISRERSGHLAGRSKARNWPKDGARDHLRSRGLQAPV